MPQSETHSPKPKENNMKTALKALGYTLGTLFVAGFLGLGSLTIAYVALALGDLTANMGG